MNDHENGVGFARGLKNGLLYSLPLWAIILLLAWAGWRFGAEWALAGFVLIGLALNWATKKRGGDEWKGS